MNNVEAGIQETTRDSESSETPGFERRKTETTPGEPLVKTDRELQFYREMFS